MKTIALSLMGLLTVASMAGTLVDSRDGKNYRTVEIASQEWMAENLNYSQDSVEGVCYQNKPENCAKYGRLYTWDMAMKACPEGWRLPQKEEIEELLKVVGGKQDSKEWWKWYGAGMVLKSTEGWKDGFGRIGNGKDSLKFSAIPAGNYISGDKEFVDEGFVADFWSLTENGADEAFSLNLDFISSPAYVRNEGKWLGFSVRCVKNK